MNTLAFPCSDGNNNVRPMFYNGSQSPQQDLVLVAHSGNLFDDTPLYWLLSLSSCHSSASASYPHLPH